ncbi:MAG: 4'-phosphopantetheinyl transferase superfamily protein [Hyphomicrobium sp.]|nr:4'-phosphopantetheinyl transferase superfamily protein [Hyphomicrobium sp.]
MWCEVRPESIGLSHLIYLVLGCGVDRAANLISNVADVVISHDNCTHQSMVCGPREGIETVAARATSAGVFSQEIPFRTGYHTPMFAKHLDCGAENSGRRKEVAWLQHFPIGAPQIPLWSSATLSPFPDDPDRIRELVVQQLVEPVRFRQLTKVLFEEGARVFVQVGQGSLTGFVDDTLHDEPHLAISANTTKSDGISQLVRVAAATWVEGVEVRFDMLLGTLGKRARPDVSTNGRTRLKLGASLMRGPNSTTRMSPMPALLASGTETEELVPDLGTVLQQVRTDIDNAHRDLVAVFGSAHSTDSSLAVHDAKPNFDGRSQQLASIDRVQEFSLDVEPTWSDHALFQQAKDWPHPEDRFPVVPAAGLIERIAEIASELEEGLVPVAVRDFRILQWLPVEPPAKIRVQAKRLKPDMEAGRRQVRVRLVGYAQATVELAENYPLPKPEKSPDYGIPRPVPVRADRAYEDKFLFHGPAYQGVRDFSTVGSAGCIGWIEQPAGQAALLDNFAQIFSLWRIAASETADGGTVGFPIHCGRIEFFGRCPAVGTQVECRVFSGRVDDNTYQADAVLLAGGHPWCRIHKWQELSFPADRLMLATHRTGDRSGVSKRLGNEVAVCVDRWANSLSRDYFSRRYLDTPARGDFERRTPNAQRSWLLGRMAAKDAVRYWLWDRGAGGLYPAQIRIRNAPGGQPRVDGPFNADLRVSIAHRAGVGVAIVGEAVDVGIDVELIESRTQRFEKFALTPHERGLRNPFDDSRDVWLTRLWAAKEAVAKSTGRGLGGRPRDFEIVEVAGFMLRVGDRWVLTETIEPTRYESKFQNVDAKKGYVVAWTKTQK